MIPSSIFHLGTLFVYDDVPLCRFGVFSQKIIINYSCLKVCDYTF